MQYKKVISHKNSCHRFLSDPAGDAAIEYAILFPLFVVLVLAVIELGMYFVKDEITTRAIARVTNAIELNPNITQAELTQLVNSTGAALVKFGNNGNNICAQSYATLPTTGLTCNSTYFNISQPTGTPQGTPYYVIVSAGLQKVNITPMARFIPMIKNIQISQSSGVVQVGSVTPSTCTGSGEQLQWDGTKFVCVNNPPPVCSAGDGLQWTGTKFVCVSITPPSCSHPWQRLVFSGSSFNCINVPYVMAGGIARPAAQNGTAEPGSYWDTDKSYVAWLAGTHKRFTLCQKNVTFSIPSGLPAGQILAQGNLIYPNAPAGAWHHWTVSFVHWNAPIGGGTGSTDICESNGGNWIPESANPSVGAEHVSWSVIYVPNSTR